MFTILVVGNRKKIEALTAENYCKSPNSTKAVQNLMMLEDLMIHFLLLPVFK